MKTRLLLLASLALPSTAFAVQDAAAERIMADSTRVFNAEHLDFADVDQKPGTWVLASIKPGPNSGQYMVHSFYINGGTGKIVKNPGGIDGVNTEGSCHALQTLKGTPPAKNLYLYKWLLPSPLISRGAEEYKKQAPWIYRNFNGLALFRFSEGLTDPAQTLPILPVPEAWRDSVLPAWKYYQAHAGLFNAQASAQNREPLQKLLADENPILAVAACRAFAPTRDVDPDLVVPSLASSPELKQAVLTHLLLKNGPQTQEEATLENLGKVVEAAASAQTLKGIALGALVTLKESDHHTSFLGFRLLEKLKIKQDALGWTTQADRYVYAILRLASLPALRQNRAFMLPDPRTPGSLSSPQSPGSH